MVGGGIIRRHLNLKHNRGKQQSLSIWDEESELGINIMDPTYKMNIWIWKFLKNESKHETFKI
jgi:hypothetical protein